MFPAPPGLVLPCAMGCSPGRGPLCSPPEKPQGWDAFPSSSLATAALDSAHRQLSVWWETQSFLGPEQRDNTRLRSWSGIPGGRVSTPSHPSCHCWAFHGPHNPNPSRNAALGIPMTSPATATTAQGHTGPQPAMLPGAAGHQKHHKALNPRWKRQSHGWSQGPGRPQCQQMSQGAGIGRELPGRGLLSQCCCRWKVCRSHSSLQTLLAMKKPLECEPRKQTGQSRGRWLITAGPLCPFWDGHHSSHAWGILAKVAAAVACWARPGELPTPHLCAGKEPFLRCCWKQPQITALIMEKITVWERGQGTSGDFPGEVGLCLCSTESPGWRGVGQATHGVTFGAVLCRARSWTR